MGRYAEIARKIAEIASDGGIKPLDMPSMLSGSHRVNCYPGEPDNDCYPLAIFISLSGRHAAGRGHSSFDQSLKTLRQHFDRCSGTKEAVVITDSWSFAAYDEWRASIKNLRNGGVYIEFYLIDDRKETFLDF